MGIDWNALATVVVAAGVLVALYQPQYLKNRERKELGELLVKEFDNAKKLLKLGFESKRPMLDSGQRIALTDWVAGYVRSIHFPLWDRYETEAPLLVGEAKYQEMRDFYHELRHNGGLLVRTVDQIKAPGTINTHQMELSAESCLRFLKAQADK